MEEEFELLESTFRKAGFQEEVTNCILQILFPLIATILSFLQLNVDKIGSFIEFLSQSSSNLVVFDKISFDHRLVHQCIGKNTHKCISYWIGCKLIWGSLILSGSLRIMWFISWQCGLYAPLFLQPWLVRSSPIHLEWMHFFYHLRYLNFVLLAVI